MGIDFYFISPSHKSDIIGEYDYINKETAESAISGFEQESLILNAQNVLIIFDSRHFSLIQSLARTVIKNTPPYIPFTYKLPGLEYKIENFSDYKFLIYLSRKVREGNDVVFKVFNIAHELQHVVQYIHFKDIFIRAGVMNGYFMAIKEYSNEFYRNFPTEMDAFKKAKIVAYKLFGIPKVNEFILKKMGNSQDDIERSYWENIELLDNLAEYDLRNNFEKKWNETVSNIEKKIQELKSNKEGKELDIDEVNFIEAYEFCQKQMEGNTGENN